MPCATADARHSVCLVFLRKRLSQLTNLQVPVPLSTPAELQHAPCHGAARLVQLCGICTALASTVRHVHATVSTCNFCGAVAELLNTEQPACCPARAARPQAADEDVSQRVQMPVSQACLNVCLQGQLNSLCFCLLHVYRVCHRRLPIRPCFLLQALSCKMCHQACQCIALHRSTLAGLQARQAWLAPAGAFTGCHEPGSFGSQQELLLQLHGERLCSSLNVGDMVWVAGWLSVQQPGQARSAVKMLGQVQVQIGHVRSNACYLWTIRGAGSLTDSC